MVDDGNQSVPRWVLLYAFATEALQVQDLSERDASTFLVAIEPILLQAETFGQLCDAILPGRGRFGDSRGAAALFALWQYLPLEELGQDAVVAGAPVDVQGKDIEFLRDDACAAIAVRHGAGALKSGQGVGSSTGRNSLLADFAKQLTDKLANVLFMTLGESAD